MFASVRSVPLVVACLAAPAATSMDAAHGADRAVRPNAAALAAKVDSVVRVDVLVQGMPGVSVVVARGDFHSGGSEPMMPTFVVDANGEVARFVARRGNGGEPTLRRVR